MIEQQLKYEFKDTLFSMIIGWAINSAMILMAAATLYHGNGHSIDDIHLAGSMLTPLLGNAASIILHLHYYLLEFHQVLQQEWLVERFFLEFLIILMIFIIKIRN